jgi:hypothetical protein
VEVGTGEGGGVGNDGGVNPDDEEETVLGDGLPPLIESLTKSSVNTSSLIESSCCRFGETSRSSLMWSPLRVITDAVTAASHHQTRLS